MSMNDMSLYDLMAEDLDVWVGASGFGFKLQIEDAQGNSMINEGCLHPYAAESFADFCRRYLTCYERASNEGVDNG